MIVCLLFSMGISNVWGQEVRGVEFKRVKYSGASYSYFDKQNKKRTANEYYGWEFRNANSISVSVDIELWQKTGNEGRLEMTKSLVLKPYEKYIFKFEGYSASQCYQDHYSRYRMYAVDIDDFYVKYRAFKLE